MLCKGLSIHKISCMSRSVFCDASRVLTQISSTKDQSSSWGILAISISVGNSRLSLVAALEDLFSAEGVSSRLKIFFMIFNPPNVSLNVFAAKKSPVHLLVRDCQLPKSVLPIFLSFF